MERQELVKNIIEAIRDVANRMYREHTMFSVTSDSTMEQIERTANEIVDGANKFAQEKNQAIVAGRKFIIENATKLNIPFEEAVHKIELYYVSGLLKPESDSIQ